MTHLDLLYSNSMCKQSSMPTSIFMGEFISGYEDKVWTIISISLTTSEILRITVTRKKYLKHKI